jgi:hypothetical protein
MELGILEMTIFFLKFVGGKKIKQKECYDET